MSKTITQMMDILLEELLAELSRRGTDKELCAKSLYPGNTVPADYGLDDCGGMAYVQLVSAVPSTQFPQPSADFNNCTYTLAYTVVVGVMRRVEIPEVINKRVLLPSDEQNTESTAAQMDDLDAMHAAIKNARSRIEMLILGQYSSEGPEGGIVIGEWTLQIGDDD